MSKLQVLASQWPPTSSVMDAITSFRRQPAFLRVAVIPHEALSMQNDWREKVCSFELSGKCAKAVQDHNTWFKNTSYGVIAFKCGEGVKNRTYT